MLKRRIANTFPQVTPFLKRRNLFWGPVSMRTVQLQLRICWPYANSFADEIAVTDNLSFAAVKSINTDPGFFLAEYPYPQFLEWKG